MPPAVARSAYKRQSSNPNVTEIIEFADRGNALVIDHGWREVADASLKFVRRFTS